MKTVNSQLKIYKIYKLKNHKMKVESALKYHHVTFHSENIIITKLTVNDCKILIEQWLETKYKNSLYYNGTMV